MAEFLTGYGLIVFGAGGLRWLIARFLPGAKVVIAMVAGAAGMLPRVFALWR